MRSTVNARYPTRKGWESKSFGFSDLDTVSYFKRDFLKSGLSTLNGKRVSEIGFGKLASKHDLN